jgi:hypothetical protein
MQKCVQISTALSALMLVFCYTANAQAGIAWTPRRAALGNDWTSVTYGNGIFVAVASSDGNGVIGQRVMTSQNSTNWTSRVSAASNQWQSVTFGNGRFVAVSNDGADRVMTSQNGITWTSHKAAAANQWQSVIYGNGKFVAVAGSGTGNRVMTSTDGQNWTSGISAADNFWTSIAIGKDLSGNDLFVAVADDGTNPVMTSPDGITWTLGVAPKEQWNAVTYGSGRFVAVGSSGDNRVMTSPDGVNWTEQEAAAGSIWKSVIYGSGLFVAVASFSSSIITDKRVMTSPDGEKWTIRTTPVNKWSSVTYNRGLFVAVSVFTPTSPELDNRIMTSGTLLTTALPLNWLNIAGKINTQKKAVLQWKVEEQNVKGYEIEKSSDAIHFSIIGHISSRGDGVQDYSFTETATLPGKMYYRIKQTDKDGRFSYSDIIKLIAYNRQSPTLYPNPAKETITVTVGNHLLNTEAQLANMRGRLMRRFRITNTAFTINITALSRGIYSVKWADGEVSRIVKE